jgi:hypothetical protein
MAFMARQLLFLVVVAELLLAALATPFKCTSKGQWSETKLASCLSLFCHPRRQADPGLEINKTPDGAKLRRRRGIHLGPV